MVNKSIIATLALAVAGSSAAPTDSTSYSVGILDQTYQNPKPLRLRANQDGAKLGFYAGSDDISPALVANVQQGQLVSLKSGATQGKTAYLTLKGSWNDSDTKQYLVSFGDKSVNPNASDPNWSINESLGGFVQHAADTGLKSTFLLCEADFNLKAGKWSYLSFVTYKSDQIGWWHPIPGCGNVALPVTKK